LYLIALIALIAGVYWFLRSISKLTFKRPERLTWYWQLAIYPLALGLIFLAIRGRISQWSPINWGIAYFSPHNFPNQLALNSCFTFMNDTLFEDADRTAGKEFADLMSVAEANRRTRGILDIDEQNLIPNHPIARIDSSGEKMPLNVIVVVMESLAADFLSSCGGVEDLGPEFDRLAMEGMLFPHFFANAGFTRNAVFSIVTGLPPMQGKPLINRMEGQYEFSGLGTLLRARGYRTRFYIPHDPHFDNMQGFTLANGFEYLTSKDNFPPDSAVSCLGVPDGVLYRRALQDFNQLEEPFLGMILTGSNHHPFICPDVPYPRYNPDDPNAERFDAFLYADYALGRFYEGIQEAEWGDNTLLVVFGDTGLNWQTKLELDLSLYRTPLLLVCPDVLDPGISSRIGSQIDVTATVMDILGGEWVNNTLGASLLREGDNHAIFHHSGVLGFIRGDYYFIRSRDGQKHLYAYPGLEPVLEQSGLAEQLYRDFAAFTITTHHLISARLQGVPELPVSVQK
ncbi:LTA synthase family protein, partial [bacterium]|nr:LTA synthase family protein [bacterium]